MDFNVQGGRKGGTWFYAVYKDLQGEKKTVQLEEKLYYSLKTGGNFIMAKGKGGTLLLPDVFHDV